MSTLLNIEHLSIGYRSYAKTVNIVDDISFSMSRGKIFGIVGESGCGKSTAALAIGNLLPHNFYITAGLIEYMGQDLTKISSKVCQKLLGKEIAYIFQDPMTSLNPLLTVGYQISERLVLHGKLNAKQIKVRTLEVMDEVGLTNASKLIAKYPHELSGGMRQRVMIASALINNPSLIIADEPTTSLDPTIQAQILQLLRNINEYYQCTIIFISHDFGVINSLCHKVAVMYAGEIVEIMKTSTLFKRPIHPYTNGLINCIPSVQNKGQSLYCISGSVLSMESKLDGCAFAPRCQHCVPLCVHSKPPFIELAPNHSVKCHFPFGLNGVVQNV